jgi:hypothetical protein
MADTVNSYGIVTNAVNQNYVTGGPYIPTSQTFTLTGPVTGSGPATGVATVPEELCADLVGHLELIARGGLPSPERGAELLRRLKFAIAQSGRGFTPTEAEQQASSREATKLQRSSHPELYQNAPPPREPAE